MKIYLVGGAIRDHLLGRPVHEKDYVVVGATVAEMTALGFQAVGKDFPVFLHPQTHDEYALARTERKTGRGYTQFAFHADPSVTLVDDLRRRDLTINAMAQDENGEIIDPYNGQQDLHNKILRHVSNAFAEDPVRILRVARFLARYAHLGFTIAAETYSLMRQMVRDGEVNALVAERVWQEFSLALMEPQPQQFFRVLRKCGALAILFPEIDALFGVPDDPLIHNEIDCGEHALMALNLAAQSNYNGAIRFAALMQNMGKSMTSYLKSPIHSHFQETGEKLIQALCNSYRVSQEYRELAILTIRFHQSVYNATQLDSEQLLTLFEKTDAFRRADRFQKFLSACQMNYCLGAKKSSIIFSQKEFLIALLIFINTVDINELKSPHLQGKELGEALRAERLKKVITFLHKNNHSH